MFSSIAFLIASLIVVKSPKSSTPFKFDFIFHSIYLTLISNVPLNRFSKPFRWKWKSAHRKNIFSVLTFTSQRAVETNKLSPHNKVLIIFLSKILKSIVQVHQNPRVLIKISSESVKSVESKEKLLVWLSLSPAIIVGRRRRSKASSIENRRKPWRKKLFIAIKTRIKVSKRNSKFLECRENHKSQQFAFKYKKKILSQNEWIYRHVKHWKQPVSVSILSVPSLVAIRFSGHETDSQFSEVCAGR